MYSLLRILAEVNNPCLKENNLSDVYLYVDCLYTLLFSQAAKIIQQPCCPTTKDSPTSADSCKSAMLREPLLLLWVPIRGTPSCLFQGLAIRAVACGNEVGLGEELGNVLGPNLAICSYVSFLFCLHFLLSSFLEIPGKILKCHLTRFNSECNSCTSLPGKPWPQD